MSTYRALRGFCYLEPKRHVPFITDLEGREAAEFGRVLSRAARAIKSAAGAKLVYVYIYGDHIPHLHVHLAPHRDGDIFVNDVVRSEAKIDEGVMNPRELGLLSRTIRRNLGSPKG
jgi:diadenosine tetraphosphate (Ap4A) HIT family hydrolase